MRAILRLGGAAAVGGLAAGVLLGVIVPQDSGPDRLTSAEQRYLEGVTGGLVERLLSYRSGTFTSDVAEVEQVAAGAFAEEFGSVLADEAAAAVTASSVSSTATAVQVGTIDPDRDRPELLVFLRQATTSKASDQRRLDLTAVRVELHTHTSEGWRIAGLEPVVPGGSR